MWCLIIMQTKGNSAPILMMKYWIIRTLLRSLSVVELSGGVKSNNSNTEVQHHISKLYKNIVKILEIVPEVSKKQVLQSVFFFSKVSNVYY